MSPRHRDRLLIGSIEVSPQTGVGCSVFRNWRASSLVNESRFLPANFEKPVGKGVASRSLPVVARGLIPSIYRHAAFPHRAAPQPGSPCGGTWLATEWPRERSGVERSSGWVVASHSGTGSRLAADAES